MKKRIEKEEKIEEENKISILILGGRQVGKTSLTLKYVGKYSEENISIKNRQIGISTEEKSIKIKGDLTNSEHFQKVPNLFLHIL